MAPWHSGESRLTRERWFAAGASVHLEFGDVKGTILKILKEEVPPKIGETLVTEGAKTIAKKLFPQTAVLSTLLDGFTFIKQNKTQIKELMGTVFGAMQKAADGNIKSDVVAILEKAVPLTLTFAGTVLGLNKVRDQVQGMVENLDLQQWLHKGAEHVKKTLKTQLAGKRGRALTDPVKVGSSLQAVEEGGAVAFMYDDDGKTFTIEKKFEQWLKDAPNLQDAIEKLQRKFDALRKKEPAQVITAVNELNSARAKEAKETAKKVEPGKGAGVKKGAEVRQKKKNVQTAKQLATAALKKLGEEVKKLLKNLKHCGDVDEYEVVPFVPKHAPCENHHAILTRLSPQPQATNDTAFC